MLEYSAYGKASKPGYPVKSLDVHSQASPTIPSTPYADAPAGYAPAVAAPVSAVLHELGVVAVGHGQAVDLEGGNLDLVARALVVVREALGRRTHEEGTAGHVDGVTRCRGGRAELACARGRVDAGGGQLERLQHRLVVLLLVGDEHPPHEAAGVEAVGVRGEAVGLEHGQGALAHAVHVRAGVGH